VLRITTANGQEHRRQCSSFCLFGQLSTVPLSVTISICLVQGCIFSQQLRKESTSDPPSCLSDPCSAFIGNPKVLKGRCMPLCKTLFLGLAHHSEAPNQHTSLAGSYPGLESRTHALHKGITVQHTKSASACVSGLQAA